MPRCGVDVAAVARRDAGAFLAAMLQRVETQIGEIRGFRMAVDGKDAAFVVEFVEHDSLPDWNRTQQTLQRVFPNFAKAIDAAIDPASRNRHRSVTSLSL